MARTQRPYSRVYWEAIDDEKFATVWWDDRALATWLRLLVGADMAWPASATLYVGVHKRTLQALVDVKLIDLNGHSYRIRGLDREREMRSQQARHAVNARSDRGATGVSPL